MKSIKIIQINKLSVLRNLFLVVMIFCGNLIHAQKNQKQLYEMLEHQTFGIKQCLHEAGVSNLANGFVFIEFPKVPNEDLKNVNYLISLTPYGSWSALYVKEINEKGFTVKSESGDLNAKFFWSITTVPSNIETKEDIKH
jgi:hypothetical protein